MYSIIYYSATGNTRYLASMLKNKLGSENTKVIDILSVKAERITKDEQLIVMYPIHAFNAPKEIINYIKNIPENLFNKISIVAVGCNKTWLNDANSTLLRKTIIKKGYEIGLDRILAMPLAIGVKFNEEMGSSLVKEAEKNILDIVDDLIKGGKDNKAIPVKSKLIYNLGKIEKGAARLYGIELYASKNCIGCGLCAKHCAAENIYMNKNNKPRFKLNCSMCMRCIYECPVSAIKPRISKFVPVKGGYSIEKYL